jgi:ribosomal protein S13
LKAVLRHPRISEETVEFIFDTYIINNSGEKAKDLEELVVDSGKVSKHLFDKIFNLYFIEEGIEPLSSVTPILLVGEYYGYLSKRQIDFISLGGYNPSEIKNKLREGLATTPLIAKEGIGVNLSLVGDHNIALDLINNKYVTSEILKNIYGLSSTLDSKILSHHNCPDDLKEKALAKTKLEKLDVVKNNFGPSFKVPERHYSEDIPNKINTDLELLLKLKSHLKG